MSVKIRWFWKTIIRSVCRRASKSMTRTSTTPATPPCLSHVWRASCPVLSCVGTQTRRVNYYVIRTCWEMQRVAQLRTNQGQKWPRRHSGDPPWCPRWIDRLLIVWIALAIILGILWIEVRASELQRSVALLDHGEHTMCMRQEGDIRWIYSSEVTPGMAERSSSHCPKARETLYPLVQA